MNVRVETTLGNFDGRTTGGFRPAVGEGCVLSIRPEVWRISETPAAANSVRGRLKDRMYLGEMAQYQFAADSHSLKIYELNPRFVEAPADRDLFASAAEEDVIVLPA
jgi:hypothetical protein